VTRPAQIKEVQVSEENWNTIGSISLETGRLLLAEAAYAQDLQDGISRNPRPDVPEASAGYALLPDRCGVLIFPAGIADTHEVQVLREGTEIIAARVNFARPD
jgi:hypothetical protein